MNFIRTKDHSGDSRSLLIWGLAGLTPVVLVVGQYLLRGTFDYFVTAAIEVPMWYSKDMGSPLSNIAGWLSEWSNPSNFFYAFAREPYVGAGMMPPGHLRNVLASQPDIIVLPRWSEPAVFPLWEDRESEYEVVQTLRQSRIYHRRRGGAEVDPDS